MEQMRLEIEDGSIVFVRGNLIIGDFYPDETLKNQLLNDVVKLGYTYDGYLIELRGNLIRIYDLEENMDPMDPVDQDADPRHVDGIHQHYKIPDGFRDLLRQTLDNM